MLEQIVLKNFQKHNKIIIDLDPLVTTLVGPSDRGKSAILRALRWLCVNRPLGDAFIRHGAEYVRVEVKIDEHQIKREKAGGENAYMLDGERYHAFGGGVPDNISRLLNLSDDINFQLQHASPFWLSLSASEVSRQLNAIIDLGLIDTTLSNLATECRKSKSAVQLTTERLQQARQRRNDLRWVVEADEQLKEIETLANQINDNTIQAQRLGAVLDDLRRTKKLMETAGKRIKQAEAVAEVGQNLKVSMEKVVLLSQRIETVRSAENNKTKIETRLRQLETDLAEKTKGQCPICGGELI